MVDASDLIGPMAPAEAEAREGVTPPHRPASLLGQVSWALFDGSRSPYNVLVNIFVFSAYFSTVVITDPVKGQTAWSYLTSAAALLIALTAPVLGAIADAGGRRKPWMAACVIIGAPCMMATWWLVPGMSPGPLMYVAMGALALAAVTFEYSSLFDSAMLPSIAPGRIGFLSGLGFAVGNAMGIVVFGFVLFAWTQNPHPLFGLDKAIHQPERAVGLLAGAWFAIFALPLFLFTPDQPSTSRSIPEAIRGGIAQLADTVRKVGHYKNLVVFLISRMSYNEGFIAMMLFTGVFAGGILHWSASTLAIEGLINSVVAALAGLFAGWLDQKIGSKPSTMIFVAGCLIANVVIFSVTPEMVFFIHLSPAQLVADFEPIPDPAGQGVPDRPGLDRLLRDRRAGDQPGDDGQALAAQDAERVLRDLFAVWDGHLVPGPAGDRNHHHRVPQPEGGRAGGGVLPVHGPDGDDPGQGRACPRGLTEGKEKAWTERRRRESPRPRWTAR